MLAAFTIPTYQKLIRSTKEKDFSKTEQKFRKGIDKLS